MRKIQGKVTDKKIGLDIPNVYIHTKDTTYFTNTNQLGEYEFEIRRSTKALFFSHPNYEEYQVKMNPFAKKVDVRLVPIVKTTRSFGPASGRFSFGFLPLKLMWGSLGLKLEAFVINKLSIGTYFDWYFSGFQYFGGERYTGYKASPFMRYYFIRNEKHAYYIQASAIYGSFDFEKLNYSLGDTWPYEISIEYQQQSWGFGFGFGYCVTLIDTKLKNLFIDIYLGIQNLKAEWPEKYNTRYGNARHNKTWWYLGGPGSLAELKFSMGGIF